MPARQRDFCLDKTDEMGIDAGKDVGAEMVTGLAESLGRHHPQQVGTVGQGCEERIQFRLYGTTDAGEQEGQQGGKGKSPVPRKEMRLSPTGLKQFL